MKKATIAIGLGLACALALTGCGRRGALEAPESPGAQRKVEPGQQRSFSLSGQKTDKSDQPPVETAPNRPFILDFLL